VLVTVVVPSSAPPAGAEPRPTVTLMAAFVGLPAASSTLTATGGPAGSPATPVIVLPTWTSFGCVVKLNLQPPLVAVVVLLCARSIVRLLPGGPLKSLACLAMLVHDPAVALHGVVIWMLTVTDWPGGRESPRNLTTVPATVALASGGAGETEKLLIRALTSV
jgi:hypothetical protein